jgi:hypothetical protein
MLFALIPVGLSLGMLISVNRIVAKRGGPSGKATLFCFLYSGFPICHLVYMLPLWAQGLLMALTLPAASTPVHGPKHYRIMSIVITAVVWLAAGLSAILIDQQYADWRRQNPLESMAERVPGPRQEQQLGRIFRTSLWTEIEGDERLPRMVHVYGADERPDALPAMSGRRPAALRQLHENRVAMFLSAAGFGVTRMGPLILRSEHFAPDDTPPVPQPEQYDPHAVSFGTGIATVLTPFERLHTDSLTDFVNPDGWGYVKSRTEVAGFRPHRFSQVPKPVEKWEVRRVELIGLLLHEQPAVYVSEHLPRMDELKGAKTREPDLFEAEGLKVIRRGDDLFTRGDARDVRMIGAIRSVKQCVGCHGGEHGDLLGAFSYRLRKGEVTSGVQR